MCIVVTSTRQTDSQDMILQFALVAGILWRMTFATAMAGDFDAF